MADEHDAILQLVQTINSRLDSITAHFGRQFERIEDGLDRVQHDVSMSRGELAETRESVAGLREHMARDAARVQEHMAQAMRMINSMENAVDGMEDRAERAAAFAKGREAERYKYLSFAGKVGRAVTHRAFLISLAALAALGVSVINAVRWWLW
jgi:uncharacterized membrane-anchored protein YhcB (DUF1043 family)